MRLFLPSTLAAAFLALAMTLTRADDPVFPPLQVDGNHVPWNDGESLTYAISWEMIPAAEGTFTARDEGKQWNFKLALASISLVNTLYDFHCYFWSILAKQPWRSVEYGEYRFQPNWEVRERTRIDYSAHKGTREKWVEGKSKTFPVVENSVDDMGTMLYALRAAPWKPGDKRTLYVYEDGSEKQGQAECLAVDNSSVGTWRRQPMIRLLVLPMKGTHRRGKLLLWMTNDARRLPLHADLSFRYGSASMDLTRINQVPVKP